MLVQAVRVDRLTDAWISDPSTANASLNKKEKKGQIKRGGKNLMLATKKKRNKKEDAAAAPI
jgi:hypothetical protein